MFLNEKAGVIEFDNFAYRDLICQIAKEIKNSKVFDQTFDCDDLKDFKFAKYSYNFNGILSWIDNVDIYYSFSKEYCFDSATITDDGFLIYKDDGNISLGTIYIFDNGTENIAHILFHEMCHLYDYSKFKQIWMNDEAYYFKHGFEYDICRYKYSDDVSKYSYKDFHTILTESMRFANFTESHAFIENINFEMFERLNIKNNWNFLFMDKELIFAKSSTILWDIYNLEKIVGNLRHIDNYKKIEYTKLYSEELKNAYHDLHTFDSAVNYIYKKLHKIVQHSRTLFDFYYNLDSEAKKKYELNENQKQEYLKLGHYVGAKRKIEDNPKPLF